MRDGGRPDGQDSAADLELAVRALGQQSWSVELRYASTDYGESRADVMTSGSASFPIGELERHRYGGPAALHAYAGLLTDALFGDGTIRREFAKARTAAATAGVPLRVRLLIAPSAHELHRLRWETLLDPETRTPLITDSNLLFSRYLTSSDWRPVRLRMRNELRALVIIADPSDVEEFGDPEAGVGERAHFSPIDVDGERDRALQGLSTMECETLVGPGEATLVNIVSRLREGYDVVYLVCHGYIARDEPQLLLEDPDGRTDLVHGRSLVQRLRELQDLPRLVVLASCQSAGRDGGGAAQDDGALAALGPQLVDIGVPAVLAMQGDVSMTTVKSFIPTFFCRLQEHGQIDRAMTEARADIRERFDWWAPVLFMRLRSGRLWYSAGFGGAGFGKWPALVNDIYDGTCLPLLGPGMTDAMLGSRQELARSLADQYHFPLAPYYREDMPQVAQFLSVDQSPNFPVSKLRDHLIDALHSRLTALAAESGEPVEDRFVTISRARRSGSLLDELVEEVWRRLHADVADPFAVLADLPLPLYVTTQPTSLLATALRSRGKEPRVETCRWNEDCPPSVFDAEPDYRPSPDAPLVFHIFGHLQHRGSLVLREDDYFEFLTAVANEPDAVPEVVRAAFASNALLFLGFRAEDWDFRVLFHSIMRQEGGARRKVHSHVAAQVDPEAGLTMEPEGARRYFESFFQRPHDVSLYWGNVTSFVETLQQRLDEDER